MTESLTTSPDADQRASASLRPVMMVVLLTLAARLAYLLWFCRYNLIEDEAQYWLWSKHLDWSYSTKGPGVAWAIWLSTYLFGEAEWVVRLPSALFSAIGALAAGALVRDLAADARERSGVGSDGGGWASPARAGMLAAIAYMLVPVLQGAGMLMTIDAPYVACWAVACWAFSRAIRYKAPPSPTVEGVADVRPTSEGWHWGVVGTAVAIGFLFKYTILLLVPGLIAYAIITRRERVSLLPTKSVRVWLGVGIVIACAGLAPVLYWNQQHGWPTIAHLLGHLGVAGGDVPVSASGDSKWSPYWLPELVGHQIGLVGPWLVLVVAVVWRMVSRADADDPRRSGRMFLVCAAAPIVLFYTIVALIAEPEGNWPMAAYATLIPLAAWAGADALAAHRAARASGQRTERSARRRVFIWRMGLCYAIIAILPIHKFDWFADAARALNGQGWFRHAFHTVTGKDPADRDLAGRVRGAKEMAGHVQELVRALEVDRGVEAFVIAQHYGRACQLSYYLKPRIAPAVPRVGDTTGLVVSRVERPLVVCAMVQTGGRPSQFDFWEHTRLDQPWLMGRPAVITTSIRPEVIEIWSRMFERVEPISGERLRGESKADRSALLGYGYRGPNPRPPQTP